MYRKILICLAAWLVLAGGVAFADSQCEVTTTDGHNACVGTEVQKPAPTVKPPASDDAAYKRRQQEIARELAAMHAEERARAAQARARGASSASCGNVFGGPRASSGEFICSNQGELLACRCSGGSCSLIHTGAIQCTRPGAIIR
jgi:hypothetical protein